MEALHRATDGTGPALVLVHGFTQTLASWGPFGDHLAARHQLIKIDLPGHGGSSHLQVDLATCADLVADCVPEGADLLGYSLGARVALHTALSRPDRIRRLVLISGTSGMADASARARRQQADAQLADALEASGDVEAFLLDWHRGPLFRHLSDAAFNLDARRVNTAPGLAASLRLCGTGTQSDLQERLGEWPIPTMLLAGNDDLRFAARARDMAARMGPMATVTLVPGGGHSPQLSQPAATARLVANFLER